MTDQKPDPVFLSGGLRHGLPAAPVGLPKAEDVQPGSVALDLDGVRWRATDSTWVRVVIVTAREHRRLIVWTVACGLVSLAAFAAIATIGVVEVAAGSAIPIMEALPLFVVALGAGWAWTRLRRRAASQDVAPSGD
ncbi:hypothetical protein ACFVU2_09615 [Leifsonia sp. NPDC058194]|uniref:hypothetical protein n=1 Tax=Leifsonia sp. NPDC058194 TaxID=3346374 RepID=UPI0036DE3A90